MKLTLAERVQIVKWAREGNRVVIDGKLVWPGVDGAPRSPFVPNPVVDEWNKKGERFENCLEKLDVQEVQLRRFHRLSAEHGRWAVHGRIGGSEGHNGFKIDPNGRFV